MYKKRHLHSMVMGTSVRIWINRTDLFFKMDFSSNYNLQVCLDIHLFHYGCKVLNEQILNVIRNTNFWAVGIWRATRRPKDRSQSVWWFLKKIWWNTTEFSDLFAKGSDFRTLLILSVLLHFAWKYHKGLIQNSEGLYSGFCHFSKIHPT